MGCCYSVPNDKVYVVEQCGKFSKLAHPGLLVLPLPCVCTVAGRVSTRIGQIDVLVETKTKDNVFVQINVSVQFVVRMDKVFEAHYSLQNHVEQIRSYVFDVVRSTVPNQNLDDVFESKDEIATSVKQQLKQTMDAFGYSIVKTLVTDINPDQRVKNAMNEINASKRNRIAAQEKAEADKLLAVKRAEAEAEAKYLQGAGIARQRKAIVEGLRDSVSDFRSNMKGMEAKDVLDLVLITQYFDTLKDIGLSSGKQTIFVPHNPGSLSALADEIKGGVLAGTKKDK
eukprot:GHVS01042742.1.p1 GENE.GHVS01042742.1~~GHVS01042742.1.p1  ORF type:complete len:284 (-),score=37.37 GHVS01042742.1:267-1118(-)